MDLVGVDKFEASTVLRPWHECDPYWDMKLDLSESVFCRLEGTKVRASNWVYCGHSEFDGQC